MLVHSFLELALCFALGVTAQSESPAAAAAPSTAPTATPLTVSEDAITNPPPAPNNDPDAVILEGIFDDCFTDCVDSLAHCCVISDKTCDALASNILGTDKILPDGSDANTPCSDFYTESDRTLTGSFSGNTTKLEDTCAEYCFSNQFMVVNNKTQVVSKPF
jgi:hypothetical protein